MTNLLELRERLRNFYGKYEIYVATALKFILSAALFFMINRDMGYMERLDNPAVILILALVCAFLPANTMIAAGCLLVLGHLAALSLEACAVALCLFLLMFFMYYKYAGKNAYAAVLSPILCSLRMPQPISAVLGLVKGPSSGLSAVCGVIAFYYVRGVQENMASFAAAEEAEGAAKITVALKLLIENKELYLVGGAILLTTLVVYLIRRQSFDHAWRIALLTGNTLQLVIFLAGYIVLGKSDQIPWIVAGTVLSVLICLTLEFFLYNLDYSRVERVQFEDDEYYYFVKAVPKVYLSKTKKRVKQITPKKSTINRRELAEELDIDIDQDMLDE